MMRFLHDFLPIVVFFAIFKYYGIMPATGAMIIMSLFTLGYSYKKEKKIAYMPLVSVIILTLCGALTLFFGDERYIKMKPTLLNLLFASVLVVGVFFKKGLVKYLFGNSFTMEEKSWRIFSLRWAFLFACMAGINEYVWRHYPTETWVNFKVFGFLPLTMLFLLCNIPFLKSHVTSPLFPPSLKK